ncbi:MAG: cytosol nonspecific dipeptidase [Flavobacteriales bacterium CG_4_10_14_0_2_um_filter_32_8]|nr:MAG: cytosol nonspecific dipeptidase [Flavobacteriales bacterium CG_4_10_14_0_2_um_filter_32_8]PJB16665.1 MAG: cytosol nonspecific dipeptidase [Flavobacteriales bacterium CG_4_9_14_3_um_filter_32_8]
MEIKDLAPKNVWKNFIALNKVPRPSKKEQKVIAFMKNFGENLQLPTIVDEIGNVIIKKPATTGMEDRKTVILQSHLDMVCQKNAATNFDFETQGINMLIENGWVTADGTTLGADNGIGVASIMSLLESAAIPHPAIEALFTIDEETGMTGAFGLKGGLLDGEILLNLDTEDDDEFSIGCAGGIDTNTEYAYEQKKATGKAYKIEVKGLKGGHSGMDIILERGNANKIINRLIVDAEKFGLCIAEIDGGSLRNAIPREAVAIITIEDDAYLNIFEQRKMDNLKELSISDPTAKISIEPTNLPAKTSTLAETTKITNTLQAVHNGVFKMSLAIPGLVETSSSLARVIVKDGAFITQSLQRSAVESGKMEVAYTVGAAFKLMGCKVEHRGSYPGWEPNTKSEILDLMKAKYIAKFKENPKVAACHAGLECGILGVNYPKVDMISFGPTIKNPHSPDEKVNIKTVEKFWGFLLAILADFPNRN